jgi:hypothetical protein
VNELPASGVEEQQGVTAPLDEPVEEKTNIEEAVDDDLGMCSMSNYIARTFIDVV